jgi:hypothetical protein
MCDKMQSSETQNHARAMVIYQKFINAPDGGLIGMECRGFMTSRLDLRVLIDLLIELEVFLGRMTWTKVNSKETNSPIAVD